MPTASRPEPSTAAARVPALRSPHRRLAVLLAALALLAATPAVAALAEHVPGDVLLKLRRTATTTEATALLELPGPATANGAMDLPNRAVVRWADACARICHGWSTRAGVRRSGGGTIRPTGTPASTSSSS